EGKKMMETREEHQGGEEEDNQEKAREQDSRIWSYGDAKLIRRSHRRAVDSLCQHKLNTESRCCTREAPQSGRESLSSNKSAN
ncbi:hypothetical protein JOQ06_006781, partial [Pogonophryne albipinna]